ncbi:MAG: DegV family protein [Gaiellaceae bacterium]
MRTVRLCTDSSAQLPAELAASIGAIVVPIPIAVDGRPFEEGVDLNPDWFYDALASGAHVTTSQPNPARFLLAYEEALESGVAEVLSVHLSAATSGTVAAARKAAEDAPLPVAVVDTGTASFGVGICVLEAARAIDCGASPAEAAAGIARLAPAIGNVFVAAGAPGGRVPSASGRPVFSFSGGAATQLATAADDEEAVVAMAEHIAAQGGSLAVAVGHAAAFTEAHADELAAALRRAGIGEQVRYRIGPSVGAHTGPDSYGAFWWPGSARTQHDR